MRILYGVQTTGHGHLVRSTPIIRQLRERGLNRAQAFNWDQTARQTWDLLTAES